MRHNFYISLFLLMSSFIMAQDKTTVTANSIDISDNLDLRAVATIFGEATDLEDFERRLNDPEIQISNLDLNNDGVVDYLRVVEYHEDNTHLIIVQAVLGKDIFQDVATIEVEKNIKKRTAQVQIVGDTFLYGNNYIYEPVYHVTPIIYTHFWTPVYSVWYSPWYWNYYPAFFNPWAPYPIYVYGNRIGGFIHMNNYCNFVNIRRFNRAITLHNTYRGRDWERMHPNRSFNSRNTSFSNRNELINSRTNSRTNNTRVNQERNETVRSQGMSNTIRGNNTRGNVRNSEQVNSRSEATTQRSNNRGQTSQGVDRSTSVESSRGLSNSDASTPSRTQSRPSVTKPSRSSSSPSVSTSTRTESRPSVTTPSRSSSSPSVSTPSRTQSRPSVTTPSRSSSSPSVSTPSRTQSSPSMSTPSRSSSSPSMSAPSRSSGSSSMGSSRGSSSPSRGGRG